MSERTSAPPPPKLAPEVAKADPQDLGQIAERLGLSPKQRLEYLLDMLAFEERARRARRVTGAR